MWLDRGLHGAAKGGGEERYLVPSLRPVGFLEGEASERLRQVCAQRLSSNTHDGAQEDTLHARPKKGERGAALEWCPGREEGYAAWASPAAYKCPCAGARLGRAGFSTLGGCDSCPPGLRKGLRVPLASQSSGKRCGPVKVRENLRGVEMEGKKK